MVLFCWPVRFIPGPPLKSATPPRTSHFRHLRPDGAGPPAWAKAARCRPGQSRRRAGRRLHAAPRRRARRIADASRRPGGRGKPMFSPGEPPTDYADACKHLAAIRKATVEGLNLAVLESCVGGESVRIEVSG